MRGTSLLNRHFERRRGSLIGHTPAALCWEFHRRFSMEGVSFHFSTRQRDGATERFFIIYYETLRRLPLSAAKRKKKDFFRLNFFGYPLAARGHHQQIEIDCLSLFFPPFFASGPIKSRDQSLGMGSGCCESPTRGIGNKGQMIQTSISDGATATAALRYQRNAWP